MGRTRRKRIKNRSEPCNASLNSDESTISLRKWLKKNNFSDPLNLELRHFPDTGRGVASKKSIRPLDVLVRVPFNLLITFDTIRRSEIVSYFNGRQTLSIQTLLGAFLVIEKHKDYKSEWKSYIDSLPYPEPLLPWACSPEEMMFYPEYLKISASKLHYNFEECLTNLKKSLKLGVKCGCCGILLHSLMSVDLFKWAYILVNTRAVYIDPEYLLSENDSHVSLLSDEPFLALCPFLDLINHHHSASTKANVVTIEGQTFYQLTTMSGFRKYEQVFISYGSHNNEKLLMEYGFFIPENVFDSVTISFKDTLNTLKLSLDERQYKYIKNYEFSSDELYVNQNGVSFVLKAILFIGYHPKILNYGSFIFSNKYPTDFDSLIAKSTKDILNFKLEEYRSDVKKLIDNSRTHGECAKLMVRFLEYRVKYVEKLLALLDENKLCFS